MPTGNKTGTPAPELRRRLKIKGVGGPVTKIEGHYCLLCLSGWLKPGRRSRFQTDAIDADATASASRARTGKRAEGAERLLSQSSALQLGRGFIGLPGI